MKTESETSLAMLCAATVVAVPLALGLSLWEGYWIAKTSADMSAAYGWPRVSVAEATIAAAIIGLTTTKYLDKHEVDAKGWLRAFIAPLSLYVLTAVVLYFVR